MSTESEKPFVCTAPGCGQRFANHDHLLTHQQRHEFTLKFKGGVDSLVVDQTPTPTRFLRNCEEAGLFQELENPFEQDFQSAAKQNGSSESSDEVTVPTDSSKLVGGVVSIPVAPPPTLINPDKPVAMASAPIHVNSTSQHTKAKLLQSIQMKEQQRLLEAAISQQLSGANELLGQALKNLSPMSDDGSSVLQSSDGFTVPTQPPRRKRGRKPDDEDPEIKRQKFLERNRAAASRCRAKKKQWVEDLEKNTKQIANLNQALQKEVLMLRSEVQQLKSILIAHKDCPLIVHQSPEGKETEDVDPKPVTLLAQLANMPTMSPLISSPVPLVGNMVPNITDPQSNSQPEVANNVELSVEGNSNTPEMSRDT